MSNIKDINQIVCGILFLDTFKLFDKWGEIADELLYSSTSKKVFGENYYNRIGEQAGYQRILSNSLTNNSLRLTHNNLIITHNVEDHKIDLSYHFLRNIVSNYIFPKIISSNLLMVRRIGVVFSCSMQEKDISEYKKTIINKESCDSITDFRFSKKETTPQGSTLKDTNNYINKIVSVGNLEDGIHGISYDYQYFFSPPNADAERFLSTIFDLSFKSLGTDIFDKIEAQK